MNAFSFLSLVKFSYVPQQLCEAQQHSEEIVTRKKSRNIWKCLVCAKGNVIYLQGVWSFQFISHTGGETLQTKDTSCSRKHILEKRKTLHRQIDNTLATCNPVGTEDKTLCFHLGCVPHSINLSHIYFYNDCL